MGVLLTTLSREITMYSSEEDGECSPKKLSTSILENMIPTMKLCGPTTPGELEELIDSNDDEEEDKETLRNEINDILKDKDLKNKLLEMILHGSHENFIEIVEKNIGPALSEELSKLDTFNSLQENMTEHMLEILRNLYKDGAQENYTASNKFEYQVIIERSKKDQSTGRHDPTSVVLVGSDNIILGDSVILSDDSPKTLPVKDLTTNTVRIKLDQKKGSPLKKFQDKFTKQEEENTVEWFKISDISFGTGLLKTLKDGSSWNIKLCAKPDNNVNEGLMSFEQLENLLFLCHMSKESEDINVSPLLNYLKPFFSFDDWQISELNARLKYLKKGEEEEIIKLLLNDELNLSRLEQNCLENIKDFCLKAICGFSFEGLKQACSESEGISHSDESTTKTLQSIVKALTKIFPEEKDYKKDLDVCMFNELRKRLRIGTTGSQKVDILCSIITNQVSKINYILDNFGNFALNIWCPNMSENLLKLILPMLDKIIHSKIHWSEDLLTIFKNLSTLNHIHCNDKFSGFQASTNSQNEPNLGDIFEPLLAMWTEELAAKARNEMQRLYKIQKEEKKRK